MGRMYSVVYTGTLTNAGGDADLLELLPASNKPVKLLGISLGQISEVGDAAEEGLRVTIRRLSATVTSGSGGSAVTPRPVASANAAAGVAAECNNSTVATTTGNNFILAEFGWNIRSSPYEFWFPDPSMAPNAVNGEALCVRCETTPADDITVCLTFWIEEEG